VTGACRICGNARDNRLHHAREMMFGTREPFDYVECSACGCVQIVEIPADLSRFYAAYPPHAASLSGPGSLAGLVRRIRSSLLYGRRGRRTRLPLPIPGYDAWLGPAGVGLDSAILDVGAGVGLLLRKLRSDGFRNLTGIDPFLPEELDVPGLRLLRCELPALRGSFDLVMFHHSLEHLPGQAAALREAARVLAPGGTVLVRIPVADGWAWKHYGTDWVQLDAPRHLYLHTRRSLARVAADAGLRVDGVVDDSGQLQLWGSELYRRGLSFVDPGTGRDRRRDDHFTPAEVQDFRERSRRLCEAGEGDQACFFLRRA
jgi:SAM-dependent methyltransferase